MPPRVTCKRVRVKHGAILTFHKLTFHEEGCRPPDSPLYTSPRITIDIVKIPYKESKKKDEDTGPQDLNYSRLFLVRDSSRSFGPNEKIRVAQKRGQQEGGEYTLVVYRISI